MRLRLIIAAAMLCAGAAAAEVTLQDMLAPGAPPVVAAPRTLTLGGFPENSLAGLRHAAGQGIGMVQVNPQLTGDGQYILMHDQTLNRTTDVAEVFPDGPPGGPDRAARGGLDYVRDYTLAEIRQLRLTGGTDGGRHPVPTLSEALDLAEGRLLLLLGLKAYEPGSLAEVLAGRETGNLLFFAVYYSDPTVLSAISEATGIGAAISFSQSRNYLADLEKLATGIGPALKLVLADSRELTPELSRRAHALGIAIGVNGRFGPEDSALEFKADPAPWQAAIDSGAPVLLTTLPDAVLRLLGR